MRSRERRKQRAERELTVYFIKHERNNNTEDRKESLVVGGVSTYAVLSPSPPHPPSSPIISTSLSPVVTPWVKVWRERWEDYILPAGG